jgi:DNA (cytosine-5)-methyltransferase 1
MTQKELADAVGMPKYGDRTIRRWENGESKPTTLELRSILSFPETTPFASPKDADYSIIDLFAGIGGTRLGFHQTGRTKSVFSSEIDKFAIKTYQANFGDLPVGDITKVDEHDIPDHDILVGGFPCQAFSQAGKKLGFEDTRGTLFFEIARILNYKQPKAFLLENVKNLLLHDHGNTYHVIENTLKELGYEVKLLVYKAKDFGVPRNRECIYIVGFNKENFPNYTDFIEPISPCTPTSVGDFLEKNVNEKYTISDKLWARHQRRKHDNKLAGKGFGYTLFDENSSYTNTISARYYKDGSEILIDQPGNNPRKLTPREAARLQGFPDDYIIPVSDTQAYKEFCNSVAVPVIKAIAEQIIEILDNNQN